ncbi:MAG: nicotinamide riboside transporter PnuC [Bacteroidota bacterium]
MIEAIAVATGLLSVWFARKENILVYPVGIISVLLYVYLCYYAGLYADMGINAFYFLMSLYGWIVWAKTNKQTKEHIPISRFKPEYWILIVFLIVVFSWVIYLVLIKYTDSSVPFWDSVTTAIFIVAMYLMAVKKIENWILWIIGDFFCIFLFFNKNLKLSAVQYLVFFALAIAGYVEWHRRLKKENVA